MNIETSNAYELAKKTLTMLESVYRLLMDAIEKKANAEVNLDSVPALPCGGMVKKYNRMVKVVEIDN